jgi:hypothetical protein
MTMSAFDDMPPEVVQRHLANLQRNYAESKRQRGGGYDGRRLRAGFVKVPLTWATKLTNAKHASTLKLALYLLHRHWRVGGKDITLSNVMLADSGITCRHAKSRGLKELETLGLVTVVRHQRRAPMVQINAL